MKKVGPLMEKSNAFMEMRDFIMQLVYIDQEDSTKLVDEMEKVIRSRNKQNQHHLVTFLMAICSTSPKRLKLIRFRLRDRDPKLWDKLLKLGFRESVLPTKKTVF